MSNLIFRMTPPLPISRLWALPLFVILGFYAPMNAQIVISGQTKVLSKIQFTPQLKKMSVAEWDFGDGNRSADSVATHVYKRSGNYTITLTAKKGKKTKTYQTMTKIDAPDKCLVELETEYGTMLIQLYDATPKHRDNFLKLAEQGYFDSLLFHRVIKDFMIQGGDPNSREAKPGQALGMGGPGYTVDAEFVDTLVHVKGAIAAARTGDQVNPKKASSGSQFYIVQGGPVTDQTLDQIEGRKGFRYSRDQREAYLRSGGTPFLDRDYTVFGQVIEGLDVIDRIASVQKDPRDRPVKDVRMKIRVIN